MHVYPLPKAELLPIHSAADSGTNAPRPNREATLASGRFRCQYAVAGGRHSSSTSSLRDTQHTVCAPNAWLRQACPAAVVWWEVARPSVRVHICAVRCGAVQCMGRCCVVVCAMAIVSFPDSFAALALCTESANRRQRREENSRVPSLSTARTTIL